MSSSPPRAIHPILQLPYFTRRTVVQVQVRCNNIYIHQTTTKQNTKHSPLTVIDVDSKLLNLLLGKLITKSF